MWRDGGGGASHRGDGAEEPSPRGCDDEAATNLDAVCAGKVPVALDLAMLAQDAGEHAGVPVRGSRRGV